MTGRALRPYQQTAVDLVRQSLRTGHRRPVLQLPTGGGKTIIASEIIHGALRRGNCAIFVVPRISLIEQTLHAFEREGIWNCGVIQGAHHRTNAGAPVQIASAQTLARRDIPSAAIVIIDESHMQFRSITDWIASPEWAAVPFIGLTATPWAKGMGKSYDDLIIPISISQLIADSYLSPFRVFAPPGPDLTDVRTTAVEFNESDLSTACDKKEIVADVIRTWLERGENRPTLCYGVDRKHAQHLQERFLEAGIATEYVDCDSAMFDREDIFERFRAGETKIICNVATLDTGIDLDVRCIIDARPTKSRIRFVQTIGRGLRPAWGKEHLIVLDHAGNHQRLGLVTDIRFDHLNDGEGRGSPDKSRSEHDPIIKLCPECKCVLPPRGRGFPACGLQIFAATEVVETDGELVELGKRSTLPVGERHKQAWEHRDLWHGAFARIARKNGHAPGWVWHQYREKFGTPPSINHPAEREPTVEILNWVRSRKIAYAKARARDG
jgi:DNA repair protein RadD